MTALLEAPDPLAEVQAVFEARDKALDEARAASRARMLRWEAQMGHKIHLAREVGGWGGQAVIQRRLGLSREALRKYELAYKSWVAEWGLASLYDERDWSRDLQQAS
jgi:hypothetical protein